MNFKIETPIWKDRSVGINDDRIEKDNTIEILYQTKNGERLYPDTYEITGEQARSYRLMKARGANLRIIPIADLKPNRYQEL